MAEGAECTSKYKTKIYSLVAYIFCELLGLNVYHWGFNILENVPDINYTIKCVPRVPRANLK